MTPVQVLERDYGRLKGETLRAVGSKLRTAGVSYPEQDVEACYNQAWHALYDRLAAGEAVANVPGFLVEVTYRRAIDDIRRLRPAERADLDAASFSGVEDDTVDRLDDQRRLREFVEGLREELGERERMAACLCYVHGYSRPEAARAMGLSEGRMKKVMDQVSKAVGRLTHEIQSGTRCAGRASQNKAYALGLLDAGGERHATVRAHLDECPSCRTDVLRLRGLASVAPPVLLPWAAALAAGGAAAGGAAAGGGSAAKPRGRTARNAAVGGAVAAAAVLAAVLALRSGDDGPRTPPAADVAAAAQQERGSSGAAAQRTSARPARSADRAAARPARADRARASTSAPSRSASASAIQRSPDGAAPGGAGGQGPASAAATPAPAAPIAPATDPASPPAASPAPTAPAAPPAAAPSQTSPAPPAVDESGTQEFGLEP